MSAKQENACRRTIDSILRLSKIASLIALNVMFIRPPGISYAETAPTHGSGSTEKPQEQGKALKVALVWIDPSRSFQFGLERTAREVSSILAAAGIEILWFMDDKSLTHSSSIHRVIPVVLISTDSSVWRIGNNALGTVSGPVATPHVYIFLPNILRALGFPSRESHRKIPAIATAMGRVAAHEVFHVLCPDEPHAADGLMMKRWNLLHLSKKRFDLSEHSLRVLLRTRPAPFSVGSGTLNSKEPDD